MNLTEVSSANPYQPPLGAAGEIEPSDPAEARYARVGRVMVAWEKLRILYNAILAVVVALAGGLAWAKWGQRPRLGTLVMGAIMANLWYCAGHVIDGYLSWFGLRSPVVTWLLFGFGTLLAMLLTAFVVSYTPF
ncbi:MAG: hypothetical protein JW809_11850 [Pirellulales bacterium]|nr:hypothetical protein [Pirellulales bacterium]